MLSIGFYRFDPGPAVITLAGVLFCVALIWLY
jgi:hypothetical protein